MKKEVDVQKQIEYLLGTAVYKTQTAANAEVVNAFYPHESSAWGGRANWYQESLNLDTELQGLTNGLVVDLGCGDGTAVNILQVLYLHLRFLGVEPFLSPDKYKSLTVPIIQGSAERLYELFDPLKRPDLSGQINQEQQPQVVMARNMLYMPLGVTMASGPSMKYYPHSVLAGIYRALPVGGKFIAYESRGDSIYEKYRNINNEAGLKFSFRKLRNRSAKGENYIKLVRYA